MDQPTFRLFTGVLKAWEDDSGELYVSGTTSSTIRDLQGDEMTLAALESMRETALDNMTVFLNHDYDVPNDLFGSVTDCRIVKRFDAELGEDVYDLDVTVKVCHEDENPDAMRSYRAIKRGVKLGFSIGARIEKASKRVVDGVETYVIEGIRLLEASLVGIPANQRSYLHGALYRAIKSLKGIPESPDERAIARELEERGLGDKMRHTITRNEATAAARQAELVTTPPITAEPDEEPTTPVEELAAAPESATPDEATPEATEPEAAGADAAPATEVSASLTPETAKHGDGYGEDSGPAADAADASYILAQVLRLLSDEVGEVDQAAKLRQIIALLQEFIAAETDELTAASEVAASFAPLTVKALEAAISAREEVAGLRKELAALQGEKAQVETDLVTAGKALEQALRLPVGRKSAVTKVASGAASVYPWLAPSVAARLAEQPSE